MSGFLAIFYHLHYVLIPMVRSLHVPKALYMRVLKLYQVKAKTDRSQMKDHTKHRVGSASWKLVAGLTTTPRKFKTLPNLLQQLYCCCSLISH